MLGNNRVLYKYFLSYLFIGITPIIIFASIFYYVNIMNKEKEIRAFEISTLNQFVGKIDYLMSEAKSMALHISSNNELMGILQADQQDSLQLRKVMNQLTVYEQNLSVPAKVLVYRRGKPFVILSDNQYQYSTFQEILKRKMEFDFSSLYTMLNTISRDTIKQLDWRSNGNVISSNYTVALFPIPYLDSLPKLTFGFLIENKDWSTLVNSYFGNYKNNIYILNNLYQTVYSEEQIEINDSSKDSIFDIVGTGIFEQNINGKKFIILKGISDKTGMNVFVVIKPEYFYSSIAKMYKLLFVIVFLLLFLGILLAILLSNKSYEPIKNLISKFINSKDSVNNLGTSNEFDTITNCWSNTINENNKLSSMIESERPYIKDICLLKLVRGKVVDVEELESHLQYANINFSHQYFFIMAVRHSEPKVFGSNIQKILYITDGIKLGNLVGYSVEMFIDNNIAVVFNCDRKAMNNKDVREEISNYLREQIRKICNISVLIGVGSFYEQIDLVNNSFLEANVAIEENMKVAEGVYIFHDKHEISNMEYRYPVIEQALYIQSLKQMNYDAAFCALERTIDEIEQSAPTLLIKKCLCYDVVNMVIKSASMINCNLKIAEINKMLAFDNITDFRNNVLELVKKICISHNNNIKEQTNRLKKEILAYLDDHYTDREISLESLADTFNITPTYLSRFFKDRLGITFSQYVSTKRMNYVKEKLIFTDIQIKDIVNTAGYIDIASFLRKFKTVEGLTPGQYRNTLRDNRQQER